MTSEDMKLADDERIICAAADSAMSLMKTADAHLRVRHAKYGKGGK